MLVAFLIITCLILSTLLGISVYYNYKFGKIIINVEDTIESSLDELDVVYGRISKILEIPVFFDSVGFDRSLQTLKSHSKLFSRLQVL